MPDAAITIWLGSRRGGVMHAARTRRCLPITGAWARRIAAIWRSAAVLAALFIATSARADYEELYTLVGYQAGVTRYRVPAAGSAEGTSYAGALDLTAYYGLTNAVHVGGRLRVTRTSDLRFSGATLTTQDGSHSTGDVFDDHLGIGVGALVLYRVNTGAFAPLLEFEGGVAHHAYRNAILVLRDGSGSQSAVPLANVGETVPYAAATVLLEYRFRDQWIVVAGAGAQVAGGLAPWSLFVPLRVGRIW